MLNINKILQEHKALTRGDKVIFYDKDTYSAVQRYLDDKNCSENEKDFHYVYNYGCDYRPWMDGVHASCFFCWCNFEGVQYMRGFDCYV